MSRQSKRETTTCLMFDGCKADHVIRKAWVVDALSHQLEVLAGQRFVRSVINRYLMSYTWVTCVECYLLRVYSTGESHTILGEYLTFHTDSYTLSMSDKYCQIQSNWINPKRAILIEV